MCVYTRTLYVKVYMVFDNNYAVILLSQSHYHSDQMQNTPLEKIQHGRTVCDMMQNEIKQQTKNNENIQKLLYVYQK